MIEILKPILPDRHDLLKHWWQWFLLGLAITSSIVGTIYISYSITSRWLKSRQSNMRSDSLSSSAPGLLEKMGSHLGPKSKPKFRKYTSFGVYLGDFSSPPTNDEQALLNRYELLVVDPSHRGVMAAIHGPSDRHYLGRIDLKVSLSPKSSPDDALQVLSEVILARFVGAAYAGILLAGWELFFSPAYMHALSRVLNDAGFMMFLEAGPPDFLPEPTLLSDGMISGLVVRNATMLANGQRRDFFDMEKLQPTTKAWVLQSVLREFNVFAWETLNDGVDLSNAVLKRGMAWCGFYSTVPWIGFEDALRDSSINLPPVEPMGAFEWLKEESVMAVHSVWRKNGILVSERNVKNKATWAEISKLFPGTTEFLEVVESASSHNSEASFSQFDVVRVSNPIPDDSTSATLFDADREYRFLGCVPLGSVVTSVAFVEIVQAQARLRDNKFLHTLDSQRMTGMGIAFRKFLDRRLTSAWPEDVDLHATVKELSTLAQNGRLQVHLGLSPGFTYRGSSRFWAVHQATPEVMDVFVCKDVEDINSTVLHTFLSSRGNTATRCLEVEELFVRFCETGDPLTGLPKRIVQDVDTLTPEERLIVLQELLATETRVPIVQRVTAHVQSQLINAPSHFKLAEMDSVGYLANTVSAYELVEARIGWFKERGIAHPDHRSAWAYFREIDHLMTQMLRNRRDAELKRLSESLRALVVKSGYDAWTDVFALAVFCAARKGAFDEVYLETSDRNPLFNDQNDGAAVFSESFALGSRCDAYFDVTPSVFGKLLSDRYRAHYNDKQPPLWNNGAPDFATIYGGAGIDIDASWIPKPLSEFQRFGFLSIFAIPALVDIALLTTLGRGLYLSAFMTLDEQQAATIALMVSLLLSGAAGTWIAVGGSYYLISMAFSAMNVFVLSRLIASFAFTIAGGILGFVIMSGIKGVHAGIIFALYLVAFTLYLVLFAAIASFQFPSSGFLSGRAIILFCLPWLAVSPLLTMVVGNDATIYLINFYVVITILCFALRWIGSKWTTWFHHVKKTDDAEVRKWYTNNKLAGDKTVLDAMSDPAALRLARAALLEDVLAEHGKGRFQKPTEDKLVRDLSQSWEATNFLLNWYCRYVDVPRTVPFSSSWNIQTKVALQTLSDAQKGIRLHSAFIHWRQAGDEVGCGLLYFVIALMDKWVEMLSGVRLLGLSASLNSEFRVSVGFSLAYYLIGAVLIDMRAKDLHDSVNLTIDAGIKSVQSMRDFQRDSLNGRKTLYLRTLFRYLLWHCWSLVLTSMLVWMFGPSLKGVIMFVAYVFAYTGLLWYQYTKIFSGPHALKPLIVAVVAGLVVGLVLKYTVPTFDFGSVIALATSTWTAAILCLWTAKIMTPKTDVFKPKEEVFHAYTKPWSDPCYSQQELQALYHQRYSSESGSVFHVDASKHPGPQITAILQNFTAQGLVRKAFPNATELVSETINAFSSGQISVVLVPAGSFGPDVRAVSCDDGFGVDLVIAMNDNKRLSMDIHSNCLTVAEYLLHEMAERGFEMSHEHASLTAHLLSDALPQYLQSIISEESNEDDIVNWSRKETLKQQCLGVECDLRWDSLPAPTRQLFVRRCLRDTSMMSEEQGVSIRSTLDISNNDELAVAIARSDLAIDAANTTAAFAKIRAGAVDLPTADVVLEAKDEVVTFMMLCTWIFSFVFHKIGFVMKFLIIAMVADPELQREFAFATRNGNVVVRLVFPFLLNCVWTYSRLAQELGLAFFLFYGRPNIRRLWDESKGMSIEHKRNKIVIKSIDGDFTAFRRADVNGGFKLFYYKGQHQTEPQSDRTLLKIVSIYAANKDLVGREEYEGGEILNVFEYEYDEQKGRRRFASDRSRIPHARRCVRGPRQLESITYNNNGFVEGGSYMKDGNLTYFRLHYRKNARFLDELLRGDFIMAHITASVNWSAPPSRRAEKLHRWVPHSKVMSATFHEGANDYASKWTYDHKFHPTVTTTLNDEEIPTPPMIENDWHGFLKKPRYSRFMDENPLFYQTWWKSLTIVKALGLSHTRVPISTSLARSRLWRAWKNAKDIDGVIVRWMDEKLLRKDPVLAPYWRYRNRGDLKTAQTYLNVRADAVAASTDLENDISSWTPLAVRFGDLYNFGPAGDAVVHTRAKNAGYDTDETLHVMAMDNGTWPNEGGGVSACRRDMVNNLKSIKWHMLAESANDFGIPKHQTEQNVLSLKVVPLWGLDFLTPTHGLFKNRLDAEINEIQSDATDMELKEEFVPILTALVRGARAIEFSKGDVQQATRALVRLNAYFSEHRHWSQVWTSEIVKEAWRSLWLSEDLQNTKPASEWFDTELPTMGHFDTALDLWFRYLFVFSIRIPDKLPAVIQTSHHSVSAAYGVICKLKRGCQLQIWDHAIAWRETNMCLSSALCKLPPFVRNSLLGLVRLTSVLVLHHADVLLPCADFFNPGWEVEVGTCQGQIEHRNSFKRKIAPVVNGITEDEIFKPVKEILTKMPTVTMLSHLWFAKDLKNAILAADIICNEWGFEDYRLDIYGSIEKQPQYSNECQELIAAKALRGQVRLCGTANPIKVLEQTWVFLNSSLSEGLPLALGEAALTGAPVVCTDVGASMRVLSNIEDMSRFSAVVAPNDPRALARAQIRILAMLDEFGPYAGDDGPSPAMPFAPTPDDIKWITARMYEKDEYRRKLGMRSREIVEKSFGGARYLREHEQMLWIGKSQSIMNSRATGDALQATMDVSQITTILRQRAPIHDRIMTRSAVPSLRSESPNTFLPSLNSRSQTPNRTISALSQATTVQVPLLDLKSMQAPSSTTPGPGPMSPSPPATPVHGRSSVVSPKLEHPPPVLTNPFAKRSMEDLVRPEKRQKWQTLRRISMIKEDAGEMERKKSMAAVRKKSMAIQKERKKSMAVEKDRQRTMALEHDRKKSFAAQAERKKSLTYGT